MTDDILAPEEETPVEETKPEPDKTTQKELNWREGLTNEDLRKAPALDKFKTLDELSNSYIRLEKKLGGFPDLKGKNDVESLRRGMSVLFDKGEYSKDLPAHFSKVVKENNIPPVIADELWKQFSKESAVVDKQEKTDKQEQYKKSIQEMDKDGQLKRMFNVGLDKFGVTYPEYKQMFGDEHLNPNLVKKFVELGKSGMDDEHIDIQTGKSHGGLPDNERDLINMLDNAVQQKFNVTSIADKKLLEQDIEKLKYKINKVKGVREKTFDF